MNFIHHSLKTLGAFAFLAIMVAAPWYFGSVSLDAVRWIVRIEGCVALITIPVLLTMPRLVRKQIAIGRIALLGLLGIALLGIGYLQIQPLRFQTINPLSPHIHEMASEFLPEPDSEEAAVEKEFLSDIDRDILKQGWENTLSIQSDATIRYIPYLTASILAFLLAGTLFQTDSDRKVFWFLTLTNGLFISLCLFLSKTGADGGWIGKFFHDVPSPPYVNRNNVAGYLILCLGPALGFLCAEILKVLGKKKQKKEISYAGHTSLYKQTWKGRFANLYFDFIDAFTKSVLKRFLVVSLLMAGIAVSLSRGGTFASIFAFFTALVLILRVRKSGVAAAAVFPAILLGLFFVLFGGMKEKIHERMSELSEEETYSATIENPDTVPTPHPEEEEQNSDSQDETTLDDSEDFEILPFANWDQYNSRLVQWKSALKTINLYHWRGSGLGTYCIANQINDVARQRNSFFQHAENQFVENAMEGGFPVLVIKGLFFLLLIVLLLKQLKPNRGTSVLFALGTASLLAGEAVSATFDFGLCLAANSILFMALLGCFASLPLTNYQRTALRSIPKRIHHTHSEEGSHHHRHHHARHTHHHTGTESAPHSSESKKQDLSAFLASGGENHQQKPTDSSSAKKIHRERRSLRRYQFESLGLGLATLFVIIELFLLALSALWSEKALTRALAEDKVLAQSAISSEFQSISLEKIDAAIQVLQQEGSERALNPNCHIRLARLWIYRCQYQRYLDLLAQNPETAPSVLWNSASLELLLNQIMTLSRAGITVGTAKLRNDAILKENLIPAMRETLFARRLAPTQSEIHSLYGFLLPLVSETPHPEMQISHAARRAVNASQLDPYTCYRAGVLLFLSGKEEESYPIFQRVLEAGRRKENGEIISPYWNAIVEMIHTTRTPELLRKRLHGILGSQLPLYEQIARQYGPETLPVVKETLLDCMHEILSQREKQKTPQWYRDVARWCALSQQTDDALAYYEKALTEAPNQGVWYYECYQILDQADRIEEAVPYLEKAIQLNPEKEQYRQQLDAAKKKRTDRRLNAPELRGIIKPSKKPDPDTYRFSFER